MKKILLLGAYLLLPLEAMPKKNPLIITPKIESLVSELEAKQERPLKRNKKEKKVSYLYRCILRLKNQQDDLIEILQIIRGVNPLSSSSDC